MSEYYYVTRPNPSKKNLTLDDILFNLISEADFYRMNASASSPTTTRTNCYDKLISHYSDRLNQTIIEDIISMENFYRTYEEFDIFFDNRYNYERQFQIENNIKKSATRQGNIITESELTQTTREEVEKEGFLYNQYYHSFFMPKKSGGLRRIDAPSESLKEALRTLKNMFERFMNGNTYHASAYAYIQRRCACDVGKKMKNNKCRWFLKTDFSDFFGSINIDFAMAQLSKIYPFSEYVAFGKRGYDALYNCLKLCFLDGKLPQGTPISPLLTNILMIPIDYKISNALLSHAKEITSFDDQKENLNYRLIYARYADDIYVGSHNGFQWQPVLEYIKHVIDEEQAPFVVKKEKTRYCSSAGRNWILGVMLNENNDLTIGHKRKKQIKAMISNFAMDYKNEKLWDTNDIQQVLGHIAYMQSIEKEYAETLVSSLNRKFGIDIVQTMKQVAYK